MDQRLPIDQLLLLCARKQVKGGDTSENLLNGIRQIIYSLYQAKEITKKIYNNIMKSIKVKYKMNTIFMNSKNSKTSDTHRLLLNLPYKINLKRSDKQVALSNLSIYYTWKNIKKSYKNNKCNVLALSWNEEFVLPDGSYSISDIQDCFEHILKTQRKDY